MTFISICSRKLQMLNLFFTWESLVDSGHNNSTLINNRESYKFINKWLYISSDIARRLQKAKQHECSLRWCGILPAGPCTAEISSHWFDSRPITLSSKEKTAICRCLKSMRDLPKATHAQSIVYKRYTSVYRYEPCSVCFHVVVVFVVTHMWSLVVIIRHMTGNIDT